MKELEEFKGYPISELIWFTPEDLKEHDKEIIEQVIDDIPDEHNGKIYAMPKRLENWFDLRELKQQLKSKYL